MSQTESTLQPLSLRQLTQNRPTGEYAALWDLFLWLRGNQRQGTLGAGVSVSASSEQIFTIQPPDNSEEWEIMYVWVVDSNSIDAADVVNFRHNDKVAVTYLTLQSCQLSGVSGDSNQAVFPNRWVTTVTNASIVTSVGEQGFICKRRDDKSPFLQFEIRYRTSGTVGTRNVVVNFLYKQRRLM
jgi:hypothetical protein